MKTIIAPIPIEPSVSLLSAVVSSVTISGHLLSRSDRFDLEFRDCGAPTIDYHLQLQGLADSGRSVANGLSGAEDGIAIRAAIAIYSSIFFYIEIDVELEGRSSG
jgi:hypothetical protein